MPDTNVAEAAVVEELESIPMPSLSEAAAFFAGHLDIDPAPSRLLGLFNTLSHGDDNYVDVRGHRYMSPKPHFAVEPGWPAP